MQAQARPALFAAAVHQLASSFAQPIRGKRWARAIPQQPLQANAVVPFNLAATFSPERSDLTIYVINVAAGEKIPRKGGPGIIKSDLFVINKTDLAPYVGAEKGVMQADTRRMRTTAKRLRPFVMNNLKTLAGLTEVVAFIESRGMLLAACSLTMIKRSEKMA